MKNKRYTESLAPALHFEALASRNYPYRILLSPSDQGVIRNQGKNGARYAPTALLNILKKFNNHLSLSKEDALLVQNVTNIDEEIRHFDKAQKLSAQNILPHLCNQPENKVIHIGGGHDHIYPLLMALNECSGYDNIFIINIDAHCDTRVDDDFHSGTPFRNFDKNGTKPFHLIQYGIHTYANSTSTLSELQRGSDEKLFFRDLYKKTENFTKIPSDLLKGCPFTINDRTAIVLSLDCDGMPGSQMQAVSAANSTGVPAEHILDIIHHLRRMTGENFIFGIYEYNPVFDSINQAYGKMLSHLIYDYLLS